MSKTCFCKNGCVPSPACELAKLKEENERLNFLNNRLNIALGARANGKKTFIDLANENERLKEEKILELSKPPERRELCCNCTLPYDLKVAREGINNYIEHSEKWICVKNCKQKCHSDCSVIKFKKVLSEISEDLSEPTANANKSGTMKIKCQGNKEFRQYLKNQCTKIKQ